MGGVDPSAASVFVSGWQPRMVGPMVDCVEVWTPLLPLWILNHLLEQLLFPRLQREVESHTHQRYTSDTNRKSRDVVPSFLLRKGETFHNRKVVVWSWWGSSKRGFFLPRTINIMNALFYPH